MVYNPDDSALVRAGSKGDRGALATLWLRHRARLRRMIGLQLDHRLYSRIDPSDVLQETFLDLAHRLPDYARKRPMPIFLWLRLVAGQRLLQVHRRHLGTAQRDAGREVSLHQAAPARSSTVTLAAQLPGPFTPASQAAARSEQRLRLQQALDGMDALDREIIALRHFQELSNSEAARALGLSSSAASKRYVRALTRLQSVLLRTPGFQSCEMN